MLMDPTELVFRNDDLRKALVVADFTFYLGASDRVGVGLRDALDVVLPLLTPHVRWYRTESMKRSKKVTADVLASVGTWFETDLTKREEIGLTLLSGQSSDEVGPWGLKFRIQPRLLATKSASFRVSLPTSAFDDVRSFVSLVTTVAAKMPFRSGHAGYSVEYDEGDLSPAREQQMRAWHARFLALDARDLALSGARFAAGVKGPSWLTLLDTEFVAGLGGHKRIAKSLADSGVQLAELPNGLMLQAGAHPTLGDVNRREDLSPIRAVNALLRPIRVDGGFTLRQFGDRDGTREWLSRLDEP
jgi:hypothetical protein